MAFAIVFSGMVKKAQDAAIYVPNWLFGAHILAVAILHIVNCAELPIALFGGSWLKSYSVYAGVQDAMVQWWYGHNAVGFFLATVFLSIMYYFVPKQAGQILVVSKGGAKVAWRKSFGFTSSARSPQR